MYLVRVRTSSDEECNGARPLSSSCDFWIEPRIRADAPAPPPLRRHPNLDSLRRRTLKRPFNTLVRVPFHRPSLTSLTHSCEYPRRRHRAAMCRSADAYALRAGFSAQTARRCIALRVDADRLDAIVLLASNICSACRSDRRGLLAPVPTSLPTVVSPKHPSSVTMIHRCVA